MKAFELRAKNKAELRALILNTARELFVHEGYESFSLRGLAARIGYSPAAIYKHFVDKGEIFDLLTAESFEALGRATSAVVAFPGESPTSLLSRGMHAYVDFGIQHPDHYRFAFLVPVSSGKSRAKQRPAYGSLRSKVQAGIEAGLFMETDVDLMAQALWAAVHGITSLLVQRPNFPWQSKRALVELVINSAIGGLLRKETTTQNRGCNAKSGSR